MSEKKSGNRKLWVIFLVVVVALLFASRFESTSSRIIALIVALAFGVWGYFLIMRDTRKSARPEARVQDLTPAQEGIPTAMKLTELNQRMRLDSYRDEEILAKAESVITNVIDILERLAGDSSRAVNKIKIVINSLAESYLPELIDPFLRLTPEARQLKRAAVLESLQLLGQKAADVVRLLDEGVTNELDVQAEFLKARFLSGIEA